MLTKKDKDLSTELEKTAEEAGGYLAKPKRPLIIEADYRAMSKYCAEKGIKPLAPC